MWCNWYRMHNKIFEQLRKVKIIWKTAMLSACGVIDTTCTIFAFENRSYFGEFGGEFKKACILCQWQRMPTCILCQWQRMHPCILGQWHRIHSACGVIDTRSRCMRCVIDTGCTGPYGVIDTSRMVQAVSLTQDAFLKIRISLWIWIYIQKGFNTFIRAKDGFKEKKPRVENLVTLSL
jgi:hypothetical protein